MTIKTDEKISIADYQKLTSDERRAYHEGREVRLQAIAAAMPAEVWLEPASKEVELYGEDQPTGSYSYYACDDSGNANSVKYVRADTLRGASVQLLASIQENEKLMEDNKGFIAENEKLMEEMTVLLTEVSTARAAAWAWKVAHDDLKAKLDAFPLLDEEVEPAPDFPWAAYECHSADCPETATKHSPTGSNRAVYCERHYNLLMEEIYDARKLH